MTLTNRDYNTVYTVKMRQRALYSWKATNMVAVEKGLSVLKPQPTLQSNNVVIDANLGECVCANDMLENPYEFNGLSVCGCSS
jgi:hypothetical protein